jgi:Ligand-gated ion channel.
MIKCVTLFATLQIISLSPIDLPVSRDFHFVSCLQTILQKHITQGTDLVVSFPAYTNDTVLTLSKTDTSQLVHSVLRDINRETGLPLYVHQLDTENPPNYPFNLPYKPDSYIILHDPMNELRLLLIQLKTLSHHIYFDRHAKFIFVVTGYFADINTFLQRAIKNIWLKFKIVNFVFMIPRLDSDGCGVNEDMCGLVDTRNIDIYSWFPYKGNYCADNFSAVLMDQCGCETLNEFLHNISLFPNKIPHKFAGCPTIVKADVSSPYLMLTDSYTDSDGRAVLTLTGIDVKFLTLVSEALNLTLDYCILYKTCENEYHEYPIKVLAGFKPLSTAALNLGDATIPYLCDTFKWFVPCPKSALRMERILNVFSSSVWFTMLPVIFLTAVVFWSLTTVPLGAGLKESYGYRTVLHCLYNVWCVFMSVSVPEMPRTFRLRALFCLFVWYSFAMSTVFQSFFISFLVSPGYVSQLSSLDDLIHSGLKYGNNSDVNRLLSQIEYFEHERLNLDQFECADYEKCLERVFTESDTTFVIFTFQAQYIAARVGKNFDENLLCSLDEIVFSGNSVMLLGRGDPVIDSFNVVIRRCIEAGLGDKYWSDFSFNLTLQNVRKSEDPDCQACSDMYFVFSLNHLRVVFIVLGFGHVLSFAVFVGELICNWLSKQRTVTVNKHEAAPFPFLH